MAYQRASDDLPAIAWTAGSNGCLTYVNQAFEELVGVRSLDWLHFIHDDDVDEALAAWIASINSGRAYHHNFRLRTASGMFRRVTSLATPVFRHDGGVDFWKGVAAVESAASAAVAVA
jgi:two-component system, chemotaxis family, CheB/CheR fusion protein